MSAIRLMKMERLTVERATDAEGYNPTTGLPLEPVYSTFSIKANVQPVTGFEILQVAEADRTRQVLNVWTDTELCVDDKILRDGAKYEVQAVENWDQTKTRLSHYKARAIKIDVEP